MPEFPRLPRGNAPPPPPPSTTVPPPPPPPAPVRQNQKYSHRAASALARFAQPFFSGSRPPSPQTSAGRADLSAGPRSIRSKSLPGESQTVVHRTGIPIAALDISPQQTHAVIGGKEILRTIRVSSDSLSEEVNLRNTIISYSSTHLGGSALSARHKDQLTIKDVKWSHGNYDRIIATAVANGRIVVYDLNRTGLEFCRFQGHSRQVHRLAFNPHFPAWLLSGSQDSTIRMWDLRAASTERGVAMCSSKEQYLGNSDAIRDVRWSPNDISMFATATDSGAIQLWDYRKTSAPLMRITAHERPCFSVDWHPDGKHVVSGGMDRQVKVWDFSSSADRRQKPTFHFRTPQAVLNVRWRPPSPEREPLFSGRWQSCQVVTSYDKEDPRIHLWDLRRPHVPFREFNRYNHATDLLWHCKDLLWTVSDSGAFTQTDIRYAPHVVNQRPTCAVAWSPSGEVLAFAQKRLRRSTMGLTATEFVGRPGEENSSGEAVSQSPTDGVLDEPSFISIRHHRPSKSSGIRPSKSLSSTPPGAPEITSVLPLEETLSKSSPPGSCQLGVVGSVPGATSDPEVFRYLAHHYSPLLETMNGSRTQADLLHALLESLTQNAERAEDVSLLKLAQTWRIVKFAVIQELEVRARGQRQAPEKGSRNIKKKQSREGPAADRPPGVDDGRPDRPKNRLFRGVIEADAPKNALTEPESTSNITTPLARPLPDSPVESQGSSHSRMTSLNDDATDIEPLPPSVLSSNQGTMNSNGWSSMSDVEPHPIQFEHRQSDASEVAPVSFESPPRDLIPESVPQNPETDQRSAPRTISHRADWRVRNHPDYVKGASEDDEFDQNMETKRAAIRDYKLFPKKVLSLESHIESSKPSFHRHESSESFPMFSESTGSSHPSKSLATSFSFSARLYDASKIGDHSAPAIDGYHRVRGDSKLAASSVPNEIELNDGEPFQEDVSEVSHVHLERPSSPPLLVKKSSPLEVPNQDNAQPASNGSTIRVIPGSTEDLSKVTIPLSPKLSGRRPWGAAVLLKEAIRYYHSSTQVDIQSAAHMLQKLRILFQECEEILPREECELIFKAYHEHLVRQSMYMEAAELRLLCVPSYPAVYEYAQTNTFMNVFCFTCKRPYENPKQDNRRCYQCRTPQEPCAICMSIDPPSEWITEPVPSFASPSLEDSEVASHLLSSSRSSLKTEKIPSSELQLLDGGLLDNYTAPQPKGSTLWTWCQGCGHGGHMACITTWLSDVSISEGGCATPGCMHDCGPGPRREHNRTAVQEESRKRDSASRKAGIGFIKRDPWAKGESKAVEKVRGMLGVAASGGSNASTTTAGAGTSSSGVMSPKKVRLVTPSEQGKRWSGSARASTGGGSGN